MDNIVLADQVDRASNTLGIIAKSTQQVVGQSLLQLGFGAAVVTVLVIATTYGVKTLVDRAHKARTSNLSLDHDYVVIAPAE